MKLNCQITGLSFDYKQYVGITIKHYHPFFTLKLTDLNKISSSASLSGEENKLLLLAYLAKTNLVTFSDTIPLSCISPELCYSVLDGVITIANFFSEHPEYCNNVPHFRLDKITLRTTLQDWVREVMDYLKTGLYRKQGGNYSDLIGLIEAIELRDSSREELRRSLKARYLQKKSRFRTFVSLLLEDLLIECDSFTEASYEVAENILLGDSQKTYPKAVIQDLKGKVLEYAPEKTPEQHLRKSAIIERLDKYLVQAAEFYAAIGLQSGEETKQELSGIARTYTIETADGNFLNSAAQPVESLSRLLESLESGKGTYQEYKNGTSISSPLGEPKESQYPNRLAYKIALRKWESREN